MNMIIKNKFEVNLKETVSGKKMVFMCTEDDSQCEVNFWYQVEKIIKGKGRPAITKIPMINIRCPICEVSKDFNIEGLIEKHSGGTIV